MQFQGGGLDPQTGRPSSYCTGMLAILVLSSMPDFVTVAESYVSASAVLSFRTITMYYPSFCINYILLISLYIRIHVAVFAQSVFQL